MAESARTGTGVSSQAAWREEGGIDFFGQRTGPPKYSVWLESFCTAPENT